MFRPKLFDTLKNYTPQQVFAIGKANITGTFEQALLRSKASL